MREQDQPVGPIRWTIVPDRRADPVTNPGILPDTEVVDVSPRSVRAADADVKVDRQARILEAVLRLLSVQGISGVSMRAVAREAGVSLGLVNYYYEDKTSLIRAALHRIEEQDIAIVEPDLTLEPEERLRAALKRVADPEFLTTEYLSLRLQLWALARVHEDFERINTVAQKRYRAGLAALIRAARPGLSRGECGKRAADIDVLQNGLWLTALLGLDRASIRRSVTRCEEIALAD
ncbi:TetR/AcrR family transcriptional regulator [Nonomuraea sp. NPDC050153]|uniref:TetR/AcrR family transcriptional regulator n=1 Tax=Nonomuraea sp. NPDC050153 TaxID=3364359 RepID=UPI0037B7831E